MSVSHSPLASRLFGEAQLEPGSAELWNFQAGFGLLNQRDVGTGPRQPPLA